MIYLKNSAGLCANLVLLPIVSIHAMEIMKNHIASHDGSSELRQLVKLLNDLPVEQEMLVSSDVFSGSRDFIEDNQEDVYWRHCTVSGVYLPELFKSNADAARNLNVPPTPEGFGWLLADEIASLAKKVGKELAALNVSLSSKSLPAIQRSLKKKDDWTIVEMTPASMLQSDACAVYLVDQKGFVNDKGSAVPLGGARLFESSTAAQRTIQSRGWRNAVVVSAKIHIEGLVLDQKSQPTNLGLLGEAFAHKEAEDIHSATMTAPSMAPKRTRL